MRLKSKVAIVTGSSKGIGASIARHMAAEGASVVINYLSDENGASRLVSELQRSGSDAIAIKANICKKTEVAALFDAAIDTFAKIDILVNNAGVFDIAPLSAITEEHFYKHINPNVLGVILSSQQASKRFGMMGGSIVNISSIVSTTTPPYLAVYNATKAAVDAITRTLAKELAPRNIRVNSINPGLVDTEGLRATGFIRYLKESAHATPLGRLGRPEDIAPAAVYLASSEAAHLTGKVFTFSGPFDLSNFHETRF